MNKSSILSNLAWSMLFIIMLVLLIAAFLLGVKTGRDATEKRYAHLIAEENSDSDSLKSYDQQSLVSFYHTIYSPYREFEQRWFEAMENIDHPYSNQRSSIVKELEKLAKRTYEDIQMSTIPPTSPKLVEAHENLLKSLNLFREGLSKNAMIEYVEKGQIDAIYNDPFIHEAVQHALMAQNNYFESIYAWYETYYDADPLPARTDEEPLTIDRWNNLSLMAKNALISQLLLEHQYYRPYDPQDVTINIDMNIQNGHVEHFQISKIEELLEMLVHTGAIRPNDFITQKDRFYIHETIPPVPFFFNQLDQSHQE